MRMRVAVLARERLATRTSFVDAHPSGELGGSLGGSAAAASIFGDLGGVEDEPRSILGDCGDLAALGSL